MMLVVVPSAALVGGDGCPVQVEVHVGAGLPGFTLVDRPSSTCREARDRIRAALVTSGFGWPQTRLTVNVTPPNLRRHGTGLDLPIAVGLLAADGQVYPDYLTERGFVGELGLDGSVRPVRGLVSLVEAIRAREVIVPRGPAAEACIANGLHVRRIANLRSLIAALGESTAYPTLPSSGAPRDAKAEGTQTTDQQQ